MKKEPLHWGAWLELSSLCANKEIVSTCTELSYGAVPMDLVRRVSRHHHFLKNFKENSLMIIILWGICLLDVHFSNGWLRDLY